MTESMGQTQSRMASGAVLLFPRQAIRRFSMFKGASQRHRAVDKRHVQINRHTLQGGVLLLLRVRYTTHPLTDRQRSPSTAPSPEQSSRLGCMPRSALPA